MMRKVELNMLKAINAGKNFKSGNTIVKQLPKYSGSPSVMHDPGTIARVYLFGNHIADYDSEKKRLDITDCGYQTVTTKSRLNALMSEYAEGFGICQRNHVWYNVEIFKPHNQRGEVWDGSASFVSGEMVDSI